MVGYFQCGSALSRVEGLNFRQRRGTRRRLGALKHPENENLCVGCLAHLSHRYSALFGLIRCSM
jgi:hypothetical protein